MGFFLSLITIPSIDGRKRSEASSMTYPSFESIVYQSVHSSETDLFKRLTQQVFGARQFR